MDGVAAALLIASFSAVGWLCMTIVERVTKWMDWRNQRKEAIASFFVDVRIRQSIVEKNFSPSKRDQIISLAMAEGSNFRPFVVSFKARSIETILKHIQPYLGSLSADELAAVSYYLAYAGLFESYYAEVGSDKFVALSERRKINALIALFKLADTVRDSCPKVIAAMKENQSFGKELDTAYNDHHGPVGRNGQSKRRMSDDRRQRSSHGGTPVLNDRQ